MAGAEVCSIANDVLCVASIVRNKEIPLEDELSIGLSLIEDKLKKSCGYGYYTGKDAFDIALAKSTYVCGKFMNEKDKRDMSIGSFAASKIIDKLPD